MVGSGVEDEGEGFSFDVVRLLERIAVALESIDVRLSKVDEALKKVSGPARMG